MPTVLPTDENNNPIPAMRLREGGAHKINITAVSARNAVAFDNGTRVISLYATVGIYVRTGGAGVTATATDHYFPALTYYDIAIGEEETGHNGYIAAIRADTDGVLYISEKI